MLEQDISAVEAGLSTATKEQTGDSHTSALALYAHLRLARGRAFLGAAAARDLGVQAAPVREEVIVTTDLPADTPPSFLPLIAHHTP